MIGARVLAQELLEISSYQITICNWTKPKVEWDWYDCCGFANLPKGWMHFSFSLKSLMKLIAGKKKKRLKMWVFQGQFCIYVK